MEKIIENALGSIRVGLEDYRTAQENGNDARFTSAIRNVFAGILLLAKGKLYEISPSNSNGILIYAIRPKLVDGQATWVRDGSRTIDYPEIKKRFNDFKLSIDWTRVEKIHQVRNHLEHAYFAGSRTQVVEALADAFTVIRELLDMLQLNPVTDLGEEWWQILLANKDVFEKELKLCMESLAPVKWLNRMAQQAGKSLLCPDCDSSLVKQSDSQNTSQEDILLICGACGAEHEIVDAFEHTLNLLYPSDISDPAEDCDVIECPECGNVTFVRPGQECAICDFSVPDDATCAVCGTGLSPEEHSEHSGICNYHAYVASKDD